MSYPKTHVPPHTTFGELYERYGRAVYRRCQYFLRNDANIEMPCMTFLSKPSNTPTALKVSPVR
ncbi:MAG: hypothetical protein R3C68_08925 [Myxococcota bacterium]